MRWPFAGGIGLGRDEGPRLGLEGDKEGRDVLAADARTLGGPIDMRELVLALGLGAPREGLGAWDGVPRLAVDVPDEAIDGICFVGDFVGD